MRLVPLSSSMAPRRTSALGGLAMVLAVLWLLGGLDGAQAGCAVPGNLTQDGIDCLVFDPATSTTIVVELRDPNLATNSGGISYFQVGFRSQPNAGDPINDIGFRASNGASYTLFSTNDIVSALSPAYSYTSIDTGFSTNPMYAQFTIPGGYVVPANTTFQLIFLKNLDGATGSDGQLAPFIGNSYAAIPRNFGSIPATLSPTGTPSRAPTVSGDAAWSPHSWDLIAFNWGRATSIYIQIRPTQSPTERPTGAPTIAPTAAPTFMPVSPQSCYVMCRDYYQSFGVNYFFFQLYNNQVQWGG